MTPRNRIENDLVSVLASMPLMQNADTRQLFVQRLRRTLDDRVEIRDFSEPRHQSVEVVSTCSSVPAGVEAVVEVVALFAPAAQQLTELRQCLRELRELDVDDVLDEDDKAELIRALRGWRPQNPGWLYQRATRHQQTSPAGWCEDAWDMFIQLCGQNAPPTGLPPGMLFLLLLEYEVDATLATMLYRRNQRMATRLELTTELDHHRAALNLSTEAPIEPYVYLVIQVEPEQEPDQAEPALVGTHDQVPDPGGKPERYVVSQYRQWHGGGSWHSRPHGPRVRGVGRDELEAVAEQMVREADQSWSYPVARQRWPGPTAEPSPSEPTHQLVVEFVLPIQLLNADVAWWRKEPGRFRRMPPKLLSFDHPVLVRSLERLREKGWHHAWRQRWHRLRTDPVHSQLYRGRPGWADFTQLEAELNLDPNLTAMLLSEPPRVDGSGRGNGVLEVVTALRAGLPVIIWHRTEPATDALWQEVYDMTADGQIAHLPVRIQLARLAALRLPPKRRPKHPGWQLAVLWDDPDRMPELDRSVERAGGGG
jgi:hypothetical protein